MSTPGAARPLWRARAGTALWLAVLVVWLAGLFRQALFYPMASLVAGAVVAVLAGAAMALAWPRLRAWRPGLADAGLGLTAVAYLASLHAAVRPDAAALQTALVLAGLALYAGVRAGAFGPARWTAPAVRLTAVAGATLVTLAGLLAAVGVVRLAEPTLAGMLVSTLQYHNSYAALALVGLVLALSGQAVSRRPLATAAQAALAAWLGLGLVLSQSRGAWLVAPVVLVLWLAGLPGAARSRAFLLASASLAASALATPWALDALQQGSAQRMVGALGLSAVAGVALATAVDLLWRRRRALGRRVALGVAALATLGVLLLAALLRSHLARLVPGALASRAESLSLTDASVSTRIEIFRIAFALIRHEPLTGYGGGAWLDLYHGLSPVFFVANETHSFLTQVVIEAGPAGALGLMLTAVGVVVASIALRRSGAALAAEGWGLALALLALVGHSAFDFDLSYYDLALLAWLVAATCVTCADAVGAQARPAQAEAVTDGGDALPAEPAASAAARAGPGRRLGRGAAAVGPALLAVALIGGAGCADLAFAHARLGAAQLALRAGRPARARALARAALALDPWSAAAYATEAAAGVDRGQRLALLGHAAALAPDAPDGWSAYARALLASGRTSAALDAAAHAFAVGPWDVLAASSLALAADAALGRGGTLATTGAFDLAELAAETAGEGGSLVVPVGSGVSAASAQAGLEFALGEGEVLTGAPASAVQSLQAAAGVDPGMRPSLAPWLARAATALRDPSLAAQARAWAGGG